MNLRGRTMKGTSRTRYLRTALVCGCALSPAIAAAQETPSQPIEAATSEQPSAADIIVTGSRISRPGITSPSPVIAIGEQAFAQTGAVNAAQALNELPQFGIGSGAGTQGITSLNNGFGGGSELINLRNLGAQRTLVLVNGRRHVGGDPGTSSVDLNAIPAEMIARIDTVTGAASAVYGADAVSGVVNIILKDKYDGVSLTARSGISSRGDAGDARLAILAGTSLPDGRGSLLGSVEYTSNRGFLGAGRPYGQADSGNFVVDPINGSTAIPGELITSSRGNFTFNANNQLVLASTLPVAETRFQRAPVATLENPSKRLLGSIAGHYDLIEQGNGFSSTFFTEASASRTKTSIQFEPQLMLLNGTTFGTIAEGATSGPRVPASNPFLQALAPIIGPIPANGIAVQTRLSEFGNRVSVIDRDTIRIAAGFRGDIAGSFKYEGYYQYGRVKAVQRDYGALDRFRLFAALNVDTKGTATLADDTCADPAFVAVGCTPVNIFGRNTITQQFIDYASIRPVSRSSSSQNVLSGFVSGNLFDLPAGPVSIVTGAEYRKERTVVSPDPSYINRSNSARFLNGVKGGYDVEEVYGELSIPVLKDMFLAQNLELGAAARYSKYSTVGTEFSYSLRGEWQPVDALRFRAVYASAVRAPNIRELYAPLSATSAAVQDPCDRVSDTGAPVTITGNRLTACQADLGASFAGFDQTQIQRQLVRSVASGNASLEAEKAKTYTIGAVVAPKTLIPGLYATVDYYNIRIRNVISDLPLQDIVNQCYDQASRPAEFCQTITRDTTNQIISVANFLFNAASEKVSGLDVSLNYTLPVSALEGRFNAQFNWAHLFEHTFTARQGATPDKRKGQVGDFANRYNASLGYEGKTLFANWTTRIYSKAVADTTILPSNALYSLQRIPAIWYHDVQIGLDLTGYRISLGAKNVFDRQTPIISLPARTASALGLRPTGGVYDARGRFFYAEVKAHF
ncbi:hypothetical protein COO09_09295 [Rhizorhabdus dicambivorans]|uniref:TonB-dependent receptor n=2 Tax=Rhizorhabdus dicambivorans TaxID=1850238 RepID=A0A2A4FY19_9SPHN|nr:hypothetical protein CMV14_06785 [Rhizorhabdus dicambivorans]PCE42598.1 hypothetical protein COO09_09295 [Rhizorhabdus dicambivorans]